MKAALFESAIVGEAQGVLDFIAHILQSSTKYSIRADLHQAAGLLM